MGALNTGTFHQRVPKDLKQNREYRRELQYECLKSAAVRATVVDWCRQDALFYVNSFAWTFRPKAKGREPKVVPFVTWDGQDGMFNTLIDHIDRQVPLVMEKSRDAGASWIACYTGDWLWRFHDHTKSGFFSRVGYLVDSKDPDSLFWKIRWVQKWLPKWLYPAGWDARVHDNKNHLENPATGSVITGTATTADMGVAGRCTWAFFDEFSRVDDAQSVLDNTKDTSDCRVWCSTHTGPGTCFHRICTNGVTDKLVTHWSEHPMKFKGAYRYQPDKLPPHDIEIVDKENPPPVDYPWVKDGTPSGGPEPCLRSPWYDQQARERSQTDLRTNVDIDVIGASSEFFKATVIRRLAGPLTGDGGETARPPEWVGDVIIEEGKAKLVELGSGPLKLWIGRNMKGEFRRSIYKIGADVAAGTGATPSVGSFVDGLRKVKVAEYSNAFITPERYAIVLAALGWLFLDGGGFPAKIAWDRGGAVGAAFGKTFMRLAYPHIYYQVRPMGYGGVVVQSETPGWYGGSNEAKATLLMEYSSALESRALINPSKTALEECLQFRWVEGRVEHATEKNAVDDSAAGQSHADHVIADALAWMLVEDKKPVVPEQEEQRDPPVMSWAWRRQQGELADLAAANGDGWKD